MNRKSILAVYSNWGAGLLAGLCCGIAKTFTPSYGGWALSYRISTSAGQPLEIPLSVAPPASLMVGDSLIIFHNHPM